MHLRIPAIANVEQEANKLSNNVYNGCMLRPCSEYYIIGPTYIADHATEMGIDYYKSVDHRFNPCRAYQNVILDDTYLADCFICKEI